MKLIIVNVRFLGGENNETVEGLNNYGYTASAIFFYGLCHYNAFAVLRRHFRHNGPAWRISSISHIVIQCSILVQQYF